MKPIPTFSAAAFRELYNRLSPKLLAFARRWCGDTQLAEDVVQDAFFTLWKKRSEIYLNETIESLLYTMVRNSLINVYQRKLKEQAIITGSKIVEDGQVEADFDSETLVKIEQYIQELPPRCKEVFLLSKRDGLTYQEIAAEFSLSIKSVEKHISKALKTLRKRLGQAYLLFF